MIPTISEIIHGLIEKTISGTQAHAWIAQHLALAQESPVRTITDEQFRNELRDSFATAALAGFLGNASEFTSGEQMAQDAYLLADAMLKAREA